MHLLADKLEFLVVLNVFEDARVVAVGHDQVDLLPIGDSQVGFQLLENLQEQQQFLLSFVPFD